MRSISILLLILPTLIWSSSAASPIEDLASPNQELRDKAAAELRLVFRSTPESKWTPIVDKIIKGQSKSEILKLLQPFNVTKEMGAGSGQSHSESYRLDDEWILICYFYNEGDILIDRALTPSIRQVGVKPPESFTGQWVLYFINGTKSHEISIKDGHYFGEFIAYHSNGAKAYVQHYTDHVADGADTGYHRSGKIAYTGQYKQGKQVGTWTWFDESGKTSSTREYPEK
jgi:antitoxin component YwqK of YwqJK toxin-antitoxin module